MNKKEFIKRVQEISKKGDNISIFEKNVVAVANYSLALAKELLSLHTNTKFRVFMGDDPLAINIIANDSLEYFYNNPINDVSLQITNFEKQYARYQSLFVYGMGNGIFIKALLGNLTHKTIVVFEPEIEILYIVFSLIDFSKELFSFRLVIINSKYFEFSHYYTIAKLPGVLDSARIYNLHINIPFYEKFKKDILEVNSHITNAFKQKMIEIGNDSTDALIGVRHTTKNIPLMLDGIRLIDIKKTREKKVKTAIIVSTGPSLTKQLELLKQAVGHATIISVDASYPILKKHNIKPDFVCSIERVELTSKFYQDKASEFDKDIIFAVNSLVHEATTKNLQGRNTAYIFKAINFERGFKDTDYGYLGTGQSAAHLAFNIATYLGHEKIIFIGQDLAFGKDNTSHAQEHVFKSTEIDPNNHFETLEAYGGKGKVKSTMVWKAFKNSFETLIAFTKHIKVYNCTQGGARINGTIEIPFKNAIEEILQEKKPKFSIPKPISQKQKLAKIKKYSHYLNSTLKYGEQFEQKCQKLFLQLAEQIEQIKALKAANKENKINYEKLQKLSSEIDNFKESINDERFCTYYTIACSLIHNQELEFAVIITRPSDTLKEKQEKLIEWVSVQGYWLFSIAGLIDVTNQNIRECAKDWLINPAKKLPK